MEILCTVVGVAALVLISGIAVSRVFAMWQQRSLFWRYVESCFREENECRTSTSEEERNVSWLR